jgi:hypothetical protein
VNYPLNWNGIRVRVGIHWGLGSIKLDPVSQGYDYYGTLVNTAARVEGVGNGGQVLATKDMYDQLEAERFNFEEVAVVPLGPQPLRGLDQPVPLFQLSPWSLKSRQFNALRLDVEIDIEDSCSSAAGATNDGHSSIANEVPEDYLDRLVARRKDGATLRTNVLRTVDFFNTAFRLTTPAWRKDTLKTLMKKWHVNHHHKLSGNEGKAAEDSLFSFDLIGLCTRILVAVEEGRKAATHDTGSSSGGGSSAQAKRRASLLQRRQSSAVSVPKGMSLPSPIVET